MVIHNIYGIVTSMKQFSTHNHHVHVFTKYGKIRGLLAIKTPNITTLSQCMCTLENNQYWHLKQIKHTLLGSSNNYLCYLAGLYVCDLVEHFIPFNIQCADIFETFVFAVAKLNEEKWEEAWTSFESQLSMQPIHKDFFKLSLEKLHTQYQHTPNLNLRNKLIQHTDISNLRK